MKIRYKTKLIIISLFYFCISCQKAAIVTRPTLAPCDCDVHRFNSDETLIKNENIIKVYSDTHIYGGDRLVTGMQESIQENLEHLYPALPSLKERTFYIGDIVDYKNAEKPKIARKLIEDIRKAVGRNYVRGNHEMDAFGQVGENRYVIYRGKVLLLHGHTLRYYDPRVNYWESGRKMKAGKEEMMQARTTEQVLKEAAKLAAENNCRIVVFGHTHPDSLIDININGIRVINVRKGCTYLDIATE